LTFSQLYRSESSNASFLAFEESFGAGR